MNGKPPPDPPTAVPDIRRDYNPQQYIHRPQIQSAMRWLHDKNKQLLTVASPPATGKTWFLKRLREELDNNGIFKTVWIDVDDLLPPPHRPPGEITPESKSAWFQNFFQQLIAQCPDLKPLKLQPQADISEQIEKLAKEMCRHCFLGQQVVLFIDNGDIVSDSSWRLFERTILEPFAREELLRLVVALREDQKVQFPLTWRQQRLTLGELATEHDAQFHPGDEQIGILSLEFPGLLPQVSSLLESVPAYNRMHPGINTFLFLYAEKNQDMQLSVAFFRIMLESLIQFLDTDTDKLIDSLRYIADYANEWVVEEIASWQGVSNSVVWDRVQKLIDNFLIVNVAYNRFQIADGIREFARAALNLQTTVAIEVTRQNAFDIGNSLLKELGDIVPIPPECHLNIAPASAGDKVKLLLELPSESANQLVTLYWHKKLRIPGLGIFQVKLEPKPKLEAPHIDLRHWIEKHFNKNELRILCFDLKIDLIAVVPWDEPLSIIIIELITYCERHGRMSELLVALQKARPEKDWPF